MKKNIKRYKVARDRSGKVMWIRGRTDISPLTYREWREASDMKSGRVTKDGHEFIPPFYIKEEEMVYEPNKK
jgi:hypothetical protein